MDTKQLLEQARQAKANAYALYSGFHVGAALLTKDGKVFTGSNVENSSFGLSICAERVAVFKAVSEGIREFRSLALACDGEEFCYPCGACRQVLAEFAPDLEVTVSNGKGETRVLSLRELLPEYFKLTVPGGKNNG